MSSQCGEELCPGLPGRPHEWGQAGLCLNCGAEGDTRPPDVTLGDLLTADRDTVVLLRDGGRSCVAYVRRGADRFDQMPAKWELRFDENEVIGITLHLGWTKKEWREAKSAEEAAT